MFNILSLDGGGSWIIIQLLTLIDRYGNVRGHEILNKFDLVIANSGGSIVLAALAENMYLEDILSHFQNYETRKNIFSLNNFRDRFFPVDYLRILRKGIGPKYSSIRKLETFSKIFKEVNRRQMTELPSFIGKESLKLVISTYDALNNRAKFFRSYPTEQDDFDSVTLIQAIHGSSNAPIQYFDFPARFKTKNNGIFYELWDGALGGFNNPVLAGILEAHKIIGKYEDERILENIRVISLGTGNKLMSIEAKENFLNLRRITFQKRRDKRPFCHLIPQVKFFEKLLITQTKTILYEPPDWANYVSMMFLKAISKKNTNEQFIRLSPLIHIDSTTPESVEPLINKLYKFDMDLIEDSDIKALSKCFQSWKNSDILNQPIKYKVKQNNDIVHEIGDRFYNSAMNRWKNWDT